ncbi:glycoside hydrolase [uncultured Dokdonia sp.]|uniref:glycoside hydrolase family 113 n=1 Tax=uncultured Dokdonia sp. TaxID=575653 RepID=UPI002610A08E|nr:glycoside hydrolase [uncultured Dokdonia sp.]
MYSKILFFIAFVFLFQISTIQAQKINGISFVASRDKVTNEHVKPVVQVGANYAAVMPFGFIRALDNPTIVYNTERQWYGERREGAKDYIKLLQSNGIKVMLKPQLWIWRGEYTGYLKMETEENWKALETSYEAFILDYAKLAQETRTSIFSIGTELEQFVANRPEFWKSLIKKIKAVYKGKLTYASNWDEYKRVPFWDQMDYVGVDAYFPLSEMQTPSVESVIDGWRWWKGELSAFSKVHNKKILFTEWGYRSVDFTAKEPWTSDHSVTTVNLEAQSNTTKATFDALWDEDWFAGGFIWKWFIHHSRSGGSDNNRFTPQNKPAEAIIKSYYDKN